MSGAHRAALVPRRFGASSRAYAVRDPTAPCPPSWLALGAAIVSGSRREPAARRSSPATGRRTSRGCERIGCRRVRPGRGGRPRAGRGSRPTGRRTRCGWSATSCRSRVRRGGACRARWSAPRLFLASRRSSGRLTCHRSHPASTSWVRPSRSGWAWRVVVALVAGVVRVARCASEAEPAAEPGRGGRGGRRARRGRRRARARSARRGGRVPRRGPGRGAALGRPREGRSRRPRRRSAAGLELRRARRPAPGARPGAARLRSRPASTATPGTCRGSAFVPGVEPVAAAAALGASEPGRAPRGRRADDRPGTPCRRPARAGHRAHRPDDERLLGCWRDWRTSSASSSESARLRADQEETVRACASSTR